MLAVSLPHHCTAVFAHCTHSHTHTHAHTHTHTVSGGGRDSDGEAALREEEGGKLPSPSTPGAQPAAVQGEKGREGEPRPAQEEEREGEIAPTNEEGEEGQPTPKGEREGDGQPVQRAKAEGPQTHSRGERAERQPPLPGYGHPSLAYDAEGKLPTGIYTFVCCLFVCCVCSYTESVCF